MRSELIALGFDYVNEPEPFYIQVQDEQTIVVIDAEEVTLTLDPHDEDSKVTVIRFNHYCPEVLAVVKMWSDVTPTSSN